MLADPSTRLVIYVFGSTGGGVSLTLSTCGKGGNQYSKCGCGRINQYGGIIHCSKVSKVLSFLEACFDLNSPPSLSMKIQILDGKITENLGFKSPLRKVKFFLFSFLFIFKFFTQNWVSLILTTF